jgi:hypothetical protein
MKSPNYMKISDHGEHRVRERLGLKKKAVARLAERALTEGATHAQFSGRMKRYLDRVFLEHRNAGNMRVLNGYLFLFSGETLVTCWALPPAFRDAKPGAMDTESPATDR